MRAGKHCVVEKKKEKRKYFESFLKIYISGTSVFAYKVLRGKIAR